MSLDVYKASAGSGKTFALTQHYLRLLKNTHHKHILAVTFTNKATEEMKERMVEVLDKIASGTAKPQENTAAYTALQASAKLAEVLHDYSHFNVSTIDGFYQQVMRSFVRELGLYGGYALMLDDNEVINQAIDDLILSLELPEYAHLYEWLLQGAQESISKGDDWQFRSQLTDLAKQLFKEDVATSIQQLRNLPDAIAQIKDYKQRHANTLQNILTSLNQSAKRILDICQLAGLTLSTDSKKLNQLRTKVKRYSWPDFSPTFFDIEDDWQNAFTKKFKKENPQIIPFLQQRGLPEALQEFFTLLKEQQQAFFSIQAVLDKLNLLPLLLDLDGFIQRYLRENNMVLLSQVNAFLRAVINDCDTPFIYEKSGTYLHHFMLDEFQDTSTMQWENFKPLIAESMANQYENLIVGDVKQSIYRWRNSDWRILASQLAQTFRVTDKTLQTNYRSDARIVDFNNACFTYLSAYLAKKMTDSFSDKQVDELSDTLVAAYQDVKQQLPEDKAQDEGVVHIELYHQKLKSEESDELLRQRVLTLIDQIGQKGYAFSDVAILVNTGTEGTKVATWLLEKGIPIISVDSLLLSQSAAVRLLVAVIRMSCSLQENVDSFKLELLQQLTDEQRSALKKAMQLPLFEAVEQYITLLNLNSDPINSVYLQAFQDTVSDFVARSYSDARSFIQWWDNTGKDTKLPDNDKQNAVQIMTVHKSKGLAFPIVIMPYCSTAVYPTDRHENLLWCSPQGTLVDGLPVVPVAYNKDLEKTCFSADYYQEKGLKTIDYINKWYVAFTRPKHALYLLSINPYHVSDKEISGYTLLNELCRNLADSLSVSMQEADDVSVFTYGTLPLHESKGSNKAVTELPYYSCRYQDGNLKLRLQAEFSTQQRQGNILHQILQFMQTLDDADKAIDKVERMGMLTPNQKPWAKQEIAKIMQHEQVRTWFDGTYPTIWNERTIIAQSRGGSHGALYRPDRLLVKDKTLVVVDYKFGEPRASYQKQIAQYMNLLKQMGRWDEITGYLYYHKTGTIVPVQSK